MKRIIKISSIILITIGIIMVIGGIWGIFFTYKNVTREQIVTPSDAYIPNTPVRGPLTLKSQVDIIRHHVLETTKDQTFSQLPRTATEDRALWVTATTLTTALNLAIFAYVFSGLVILLGLLCTWVGILPFL